MGRRGHDKVIFRLTIVLCMLALSAFLGSAPRLSGATPPAIGVAPTNPAGGQIPPPPAATKTATAPAASPASAPGPMPSPSPQATKPPRVNDRSAVTRTSE